MKIQPAVWAETKKIALGAGVLTVLMIGVFLILGRFDYTVLLGAALGYIAAVGNFFLMALAVQRAADSMPALPPREEEKEEEAESEKDLPLSEEAKQAGKRVQRSYAFRLLLIAMIAFIAVKAPIFHSVAALLPLLFPRLVISIMALLQKKQKEA